MPTMKLRALIGRREEEEDYKLWPANKSDD